MALDFPGGSDGKEYPLQCRRPRFDPKVGTISTTIPTTPKKGMAPHSSNIA